MRGTDVSLALADVATQLKLSVVGVQHQYGQYLCV